MIHIFMVKKDTVLSRSDKKILFDEQLAWRWGEKQEGKAKKGKKEMNDDGRTSKDTRHKKKGGEERNVKKVKRYGT